MVDFPEIRVEDDAFLKETGIADLSCYVFEEIRDGYHEWDRFAKAYASFAALAFKKHDLLSSEA